MNRLTVANLGESFGAHHVLKDVSFDLATGEVIVLLGASGSGKTTLLRTIAGLQDASGGSVAVNGRTVLAPADGIDQPPEKRGLGMVFQSYALWPHKTVRQNVEYGLILNRVSKANLVSRVDEALNKVGLDGLAERYPSQLSGGQQQRVALARAMVYEPSIVLMDEPLSNLDAQLREEARAWLKSVIVELQLSAVIVTHDQSEAMAIADRIILLMDGVIEQAASPMEIYNAPASLKAASFFGTNNIVPCHVKSGSDNQVELICDGFSLAYPREQLKDIGTGMHRLLFRAESAEVHDTPFPNTIPAELVTAMYLGVHWEYLFRAGTLMLRVFGQSELRSGQKYWLSVNLAKAFVFESP